MSKFQRTFAMVVEGRSGTLHDFHTPATVIFEVNKRAMSGVNSGHFMIYNLGADIRGDIEYDSAIDGDIKRSFQFSAGYESELSEPLLFQGTIKKAFYYRDGPNIVTDITVLDGLDAIKKGQIELTRNYPWNHKVEAERIIKTLNQYGVKLGVIGTLFDNAKNSRGVTWVGSTWDVLKKLAATNGGYACIDNGKVYLMAPTDVLVLAGAVQKLDASTGLIGTPRRSGWIVDADMLFEPNIQLMQQIRVVSAVNRSINGLFSVQALCHRGIISGAKDGGVVTSLSLMGNPDKFNLVTPV